MAGPGGGSGGENPRTATDVALAVGHGVGAGSASGSSAARTYRFRLIPLDERHPRDRFTPRIPRKNLGWRKCVAGSSAGGTRFRFAGGL